MLVTTLTHLKPENRAAGGKARSLARMMQLKLPVPAGFVIFPDAFQQRKLSHDARQAIEAASEQLWPAQKALKLAVRSSGVAEDSVNASYAGEFVTMLNVVRGAELFTAIETVYAARNSDRVRSYQQSKGLGPTALAIVVQEMVPAELAGVLFTVDPLNGRLSHMPGQAVAGLGEALVSGEVTGMAFQLSRPDGKISSPEPLPKLSRRLAKQLARHALLLEETLGSPQDIEWAVAAGRLFLLQTRPVTTLQPYNPLTGEYNSSLQGEYLWTNSNFGEALPDVMTPATWSVIKIFIREAIPFDFLQAHPFMGNIGGRFYMNMSLMASLFMALGFSRERLNRESEEFFGNLPEGIEIPLLPLRFWPTIRKFAPAAIRQFRRVRANRAKVVDFAASVPQQVIELNAKIREQQEPAGLSQLWHDEIHPLYVRASQLLQAGTSDYENRYRNLKSRLGKLCDEADTNTLLTGLSIDGATLASLGPLLGVSQVKRGQLSLEEYGQQYGHRGPHEYELSWPRPAEDPGWVTEQITNLGSSDPAELMAKQAERRSEAWQRFQAKHPGKVKHINAQLEQMAQSARTRESIRSEMVRAYGLIRSVYLQAAAVLGMDDAIFFLEYEELLQALIGQEIDQKAIKVRQSRYQQLCELPPYPGIIIGRFDPEAWAADPKRSHDIFDARQSAGDRPAADKNLLTGFAGAVGQVEGVVRLLNRPEDGHLLLPGEILVTATTNVGWTPLFPKAAAIITDVGAPLSHAAIVARELGIPAVVGTGDATRRLHDGDIIRLNGSEGWVKIVTQKVQAETGENHSSLH